MAAFFLKAAMPANGKQSLGIEEVGEILQEGLDSVVRRGKANKGDKTMVDAMEPAVKAFKDAQKDSLEKALRKASEAAKKGAESTIAMRAKKGRASYLGERSEGYMDPGAESTSMLFEELYKAVKG